MTAITSRHWCGRLDLLWKSFCWAWDWNTNSVREEVTSGSSLELRTQPSARARAGPQEVLTVYTHPPVALPFPVSLLEWHGSSFPRTLHLVCISILDFYKQRIPASFSFQINDLVHTGLSTSCSYCGKLELHFWKSLPDSLICSYLLIFVLSP